MTARRHLVARLAIDRTKCGQVVPISTSGRRPMPGPIDLPYLIQVHPTRGGAVGALVDHDSGPADVLLLIDLGYSADDHEVGRQQLSKLPQQGFKSVSGLEEVYPPVYSWSYRADLGSAPRDTQITVLAEIKRSLVYSGIFISSPAWFRREASSRSAAVAIGNFCFIDNDPFAPGFFEGRMQVLVAAAMAKGQVMGASIGRVARR